MEVVGPQLPVEVWCKVFLFIGDVVALARCSVVPSALFLFFIMSDQNKLVAFSAMVFISNQ